MITHAANVTVFVKEYDEAINWYTEKMGLELRANVPFGEEGYRWVTGNRNTQATRSQNHTRT